MSNYTLTIDMRSAVIALSDALDLVGIDELQHGKRVAYIAVQCAKKLGLDENSCNELFEIGLIHDIGVSKTLEHKHLVEEFEWSEEHIHCQIGFDLLKDYAPFYDYAIPILHHHTRWEALKTLNLSSRQKRFANLIHLADKVCALATPFYGANILEEVENICAVIESKKDCHFNGSLVVAFLDIAKSPAFWIAMEARYIVNFINDWTFSKNPLKISLDEVCFLANIFAFIVDAKSQFTAEHSLNVAALACFMAETYGLSKTTCIKINITGLLHDIGKLRIPDEILDKNGTLNLRERAIINQHSFETYEILRKIKGLEDIAQWAGFHHETLNQTGYPFHPSTNNISIEARIICVADIFQALAQHRPYRNSMTAEEIVNELNIMVAAGEIDEMIVDIVNDNLEKCYEIATSKQNLFSKTDDL